jgi:hypothetical protein
MRTDPGIDEGVEIASTGKAQAAVRARLGVTSRKSLTRLFEVANQGKARRTTGQEGGREGKQNKTVAPDREDSVGF